MSGCVLLHGGRRVNRMVGRREQATGPTSLVFGCSFCMRVLWRTWLRFADRLPCSNRWVVSWFSGRPWLSIAASLTP